MVTPKIHGNKLHAGRKCSLTAAFLSCTALVYMLVLGTQFKMMTILGNHHEHHPPPAGHPHVEKSGQSRRQKSALARKIDVALLQTSKLNNIAHAATAAAEVAPASNSNGDQSHPQIIHSGGGALTNPDEPTPDETPENHNAQQEQTNTNEQSQLYKTMALSIAAKWNITTPNAVELLEQQFEKVNDYDPQTDFFHFHHLYKSGGTSISSLMDKTVGLPQSSNGGGYEGILPGSYQSGNFDHEEALADITTRLSWGTKREDLPYRASYAHTGLRPVHGPKRTKTGIFFLKHLPPNKRLRVITMLRDPTDFRASNHAMIMCGLNYEVSRFNNERAVKGLPVPVCSPKDGLNISALVDRKVHDLLEKCRKADEIVVDGGPKPKKVNQQQRKQCKEQESGVDTLFHCRSARNLLASPQYDKHFRSMFKGLMGRFHRGQQFTNSTAYGRMGYGFERAEDSNGYSVEAVEEYTLQDLGGLDLTISGAGDGAGPPEPDFIWFGITERMKESTTLFYYYFKAAPLPKVPIHRIQECRPTSWWTKEDREVVKEREPADYAVWRAANAILDVRMEKMKMEIQALLDAGETKESLFYVDWDQLEEVGVKLKGQLLIMSQ
ncbi:hypothetical protein ACHAXR_006915 [Thalassiosira sp. AJA248-18]